jgi:UDP-glucose:(heptosyl)LPS alpha-1,3-glucosyltransferase
MDSLASVAIVMRQLRRRTGAVRHARVQIRLLAALGARVDVYGELVDPQTVKEAGGIPHTCSTWPFWGYRARKLFNARVLRRLNRGNYDLVVGHGNIMRQDVLCLHNCVHLAHELIYGHPPPTDHVMSRLHGEILRAKSFRLLIANSNLMKRDLVERFNIDPQRIGVVHRGHDPVQFTRDERDARRPRLRAKLGVGPDDILIGLVTSGNFRKRNVAFFLRCAAQIPADLVSRCRFLVVGREKRIDRYREMAQELGLAKRVVFSDAVPQVQDVFHALDVYVLPAKIEEFGRTVLEAMACGLPVVTSDRVGCAELMEGDSRAFVFPSEEEQELVRRLRQLITDPDLRQRLGYQNRSVALQNTEQHEAERLESLLRVHGLI